MLKGKISEREEEQINELISSLLEAQKAVGRALVGLKIQLKETEIVNIVNDETLDLIKAMSSRYSEQIRNINCLKKVLDEQDA